MAICKSPYVRRVTLITGLKAGDPSRLGTQPLIMTNLAWELGTTERREFLRRLKDVVHTKQPIGRLFSFHKLALVHQGYIKVDKIPRKEWKQSSGGI